MELIGKGSLASIALAGMFIMAPFGVSSDKGATDLLQVKEACADHGSCCGGEGTCQLTDGFYIIDQQHPSWWERIAGCSN